MKIWQSHSQIKQIIKWELVNFIIIHNRIKCFPLDNDVTECSSLCNARTNHDRTLFTCMLFWIHKILLLKGIIWLLWLVQRDERLWPSQVEAKLLCAPLLHIRQLMLPATGYNGTGNESGVQLFLSSLFLRVTVELMMYSGALADYWRLEFSNLVGLWQVSPTGH